MRTTSLAVAEVLLLACAAVGEPPRPPLPPPIPLATVEAVAEAAMAAVAGSTHRRERRLQRLAEREAAKETQPTHRPGRLLFECLPSIWMDEKSLPQRLHIGAIPIPSARELACLTSSPAAGTHADGARATKTHDNRE